eukprot:GHRQ01032207.1.p2 GENE.GHRQ01032207.1~~GHRQ01032207.1.p2  ORF type:complete len:102 (+),score=31.69 GHRQ01032207.1:488-793(+)
MQCVWLVILRGMRMMQVRKELTSETRRKVNTLIITDVHGRDIIDTFVRDSIMNAREFAWESQLRFYWDKGMVSACTAVVNTKLCSGALLRSCNSAQQLLLA